MGGDVRAEPRPSIERVYRDARLGLVRLAYLLTGERDGAEDLVQTAFLAAQPRWAELDDPVAYLRRVIVNQANERHRRRYRRPPDAGEPVTHQPELDETWAAGGRVPHRAR
jgi:DNA-directed RNA polymerase specialized sigma24 family protein